MIIAAKSLVIAVLFLLLNFVNLFKRCNADDKIISEADTSACKVLDKTPVQEDDNGFLKDPRNGIVYRTVKIGSQTWMAENMNLETEDSWCYEDNESNCQKYGRLYSWEAAVCVCPAGWHLPSKEDFETLYKAMGEEDINGFNAAGEKLKSTSGWSECDYGGKSGNGTDAFGFSALPGGGGFSNGYIGEGKSAAFWSSTEDNYHIKDGAYSLRLANCLAWARLNYGYKKGFESSVRCVKD